MSKTTPELSKNEWKIIRTCLILRKKELEKRMDIDGDLRVVQIERVLGKLP